MLRIDHSIVPVSPPNDILGECPTWSEEDQSLHWIDVRGQALRCLNIESGAIRNCPMPEMVGCIAMRAAHEFLVALRSSIATFNPATGAFKTVAGPHAGIPNMRFNDGRCDRQGRFWVGSMNDVTREPVGYLYRLDGNGCVRMLDLVAVPNSLCWSPDGRTMYFSDGREPLIWAFAFDPATGTLTERREFARLAPGNSVPDGATVDDQGYVWSAIYGAGVINRYAPDGILDRVIEMPVSQPTSCAFGGPDLDTLFITTARQRLSQSELAAQPLAGALLAMRLDVRGLPEPKYAA
jgi:sugar lactone lactonase YvrE